uniref:Uncharacterized protein n=1 Tax=Setaria viridis TaxID=4556 RepID=A0A4U6UYB4_SETVI|nr:hypothetical protein SEVIR_4G098702v2 [Setaria viridis]
MQQALKHLFLSPCQMVVFLLQLDLYQHFKTME